MNINSNLWWLRGQECEDTLKQMCDTGCGCEGCKARQQEGVDILMDRLGLVDKAALERPNGTLRIPVGDPIEKGNKIGAIKWLRAATGLGLKDSKDALEYILTCANGPAQVTKVEGVPQADYDSLVFRFGQLQRDYDSLDTRYDTMMDRYGELRAEMDEAENKESANIDLIGETVMLQAQIEALEIKNATLMEVIMAIKA